MAIPDNRGGNQQGPQTSPMNINPLGGNGQSGNATQAARYVPGMKSLGSTGVQTMAQEGGAKLAGNPIPGYATPKGADVTPVTEPSQLPDQHVMDGSPLGPGATSVNLPNPPSSDPDVQMIQNYLPAMEFWAMQPDTPQSTKDYVQTLKTLMPSPGLNI